MDPGFRLVASDGLSDAVKLDGHGSYATEPEGYESKRLLDEFMVLHYGLYIIRNFSFSESMRSSFLVSLAALR